MGLEELFNGSVKYYTTPIVHQSQELKLLSFMPYQATNAIKFYKTKSSPLH